MRKLQLHYIVRDHDKDLFEAKKKTLKLIEKDMNEKWGEGTVALTISEQYRNMAEIIATCMHLIDNAKKACENADVAPLVLPIRGGTDGCQLSFKGLLARISEQGDMLITVLTNILQLRVWIRVWMLLQSL